MSTQLIPGGMYFHRLAQLFRTGITNQGTSINSLRDSNSRPRRRRANLLRRNQELVAQFGYNMPRKIRRSIARAAQNGVSA
jgi:hypothetical protein